MELSTLVFLSLVLCGVEDVYADGSLAKLTTRVTVVEMDLKAWKLISINTETELINKFNVWELSLKEELTSTFLPSLIKPLVKQAITDILKEEYIGNAIRGHIFDEVTSLNASLQNKTTQLEAITQDLRRVERGTDTYRETVGKERGELTKDIRALNQTVARATSYIRMLESKLNQTIGDLFEARQTITVLKQDFMTLNTSCAMTGKEVESYREGLQEMELKLPTEIQSLNIQLNQTIGDLFEARQTIAGLTQDFMTLNTSCAMTGKEVESYREGLQEMELKLPIEIQSLNVQLNQTIGDLFEARQTITGLTQDFMTLNTSCAMTGKEVESYREGLQEMELKLPTEIQSLNIQLNQTIGDLFETRQTIAGLTQDFMTLNTSCCRMREEIKEDSTTTYPDTTAASTDPSLSKTVPPTPVTTQDPDPHATPSPATDRDLYSASEDGDLERVKRILAAGHVDINTRGDYSGTPVMAAAVRGHRDVVEFLVGRGADVSLVNRYGSNVLHYACWGVGDLEIVKLIVSLNVLDINAMNNYGSTAVYYARFYGHQRVVEFLVSRGGH
ncbi:uncharacterized protein LOC124265130 isoform X2 [Haliotis rubra]|uniref:uncharacterized protein LOC124265130 isoform X2 n=1 Tax=Haliotis rubra TaxID=36100 RepID=UPI001EE5C954|nr:uncharacterized protein LOC124265130 isoform X2 [Haliotis rubra]